MAVSSPRRLVVVLAVVGIVALPAVALRAVCAGKSCEQAKQSPAPAPFCSLDAGTRAIVTAGFYARRSPDVIAVTNNPGTVVTPVGGGLDVPWPSSADGATETEVPFVLFGNRLRVRTQTHSAIGLDQIAPTLASLMRIHRPHPYVRSGRAIDGISEQRAAPLAVEIVWKGVGMSEVNAHGGSGAPYLSSILDARGVDGLAGVATPGSLPLDPAAVLTTIGTGGLPSEHGVTGTVFMGDDGPVRTFSARAPEPVIAALGDDLDERDTGGAAKIALVADAPTDRGLIGGTWYGKPDDDMIQIGGDPIADVSGLLGRGWGADAVPDLVGVTLRGSLSSMDTVTKRIVHDVQRAVPTAAFVVTSTGSTRAARAAVDANTDLVASVDAAIPATASVVAAAGSDGLFLDRATTTAGGITTQSIVDVLKAQTGADGSPLFADAFPSFAVQFGRYCA